MSIRARDLKEAGACGWALDNLMVPIRPPFLKQLKQIPPEKRLALRRQSISIAFRWSGEMHLKTVSHRFELVI
jgi:hypothetical protein